MCPRSGAGPRKAVRASRSPSSTGGAAAGSCSAPRSPTKPLDAERRPRPKKIVDAATTGRQLEFGALIGSLRTMFVDGCEVPLRHVHQIADRDGAPAGTVLVMPAWRAGQRFGLKTVMVFPGNGARGLPGLHSTYLLYDARTGEPLAQLDGDQITTRRTAAAAALAASYLARPDAHRLLVVGAGRVASLLADAMRSVRPIDEVIVWNHRRDSADRLAAEIGRAHV